MERRSYKLERKIFINDVSIDEIIIDSHVDKHKDHITDEVIKSLVYLLDGKKFISAKDANGFSYYVSKVLYDERVYRLVWLLEDSKFYIGIITAFKEKGAKHDVP